MDDNCFCQLDQFRQSNSGVTAAVCVHAGRSVSVSVCACVCVCVCARVRLPVHACVRIPRHG